jgi:nucleoid DNA-binding protein
MNLSTNSLYLTSTLKKLQTKLARLNESLKLNSSDDTIKRKIELLTNKKNIFELYDKFNVVSNPTDSFSYASSITKSCPPGKEINPKTGRCVKIKTQKVKKVKSGKIKTPKVVIKLEPEIKLEPVKELEQRAKICPEGKEINPKTGRCIKIKTQKVKKVKIPKVKTTKQKVVIKLEPVKEVEQRPKICPEGKEINPKTGRCIKIKTQKVKKVKTQKVKTLKQKIKE